MDTSKEYIKMCDCPEIQKQEPDASGEYMGCRNGDESGKSGFVWTPRQDQIQEMVREFYSRKVGNKKPHNKWFPEGYVGLGYVLGAFCTHIKKNQLMQEKYKSFEQLWLAFYMWESDEKIWDGKEWRI